MKSSLFLIEQIIAVLIFAICSAVCVWIFAASYDMSAEAEDMNNALIIAKNAAECYKAVSGDVQETARILGGVSMNGAVYAYYDKNRLPCEEKAAVYILSVEERDSSDVPINLIVCDISLKRQGEEVLSLAVAARRKH